MIRIMAFSGGCSPSIDPPHRIKLEGIGGMNSKSIPVRAVPVTGPANFLFSVLKTRLTKQTKSSDIATAATFLSVAAIYKEAD